ncbi:MAG: response regulator, partial [Alphaproteobacteria bacterium]
MNSSSQQAGYGTVSEEVRNKFESSFGKIDESVEFISHQHAKILETSSTTDFHQDVIKIGEAIEKLRGLSIREKESLLGHFQQGSVTDDELKRMRHDLRGCTGATLGYSELIREEIQDDPNCVAPSFATALEALYTSAKDIIPIIDSMRMEAPKDSEKDDIDTSSVKPGKSGMEETLSPYYQDSHVLVIDDSPYNRDILSRRLERLGLNVITAEDGIKGLDAVKENDVDLILLDIMMPGLNGYEVLTRLKSDNATSPIPVLMITAISDVDSIVHCIEAGADDYLPTPFNPTVLHARIKACLDKKKLRDREQENLSKLTEARQKLVAAIESIDHGFAIFDHDGALTLYNETFSSLYPGLENIKPADRTLTSVIRENIRLGVYFQERRGENAGLGMSDDQLEDETNLLAARHQGTEPFFQQLQDGRWLEIISSRTPDGGIVSVHKDVTEQKKDEARLKHLAAHDGLTGLANKTSFEKFLGQCVESVDNGEQKSFSLMYLDLDGFKAVNDTYGHDVGDRVLVELANILTHILRIDDVFCRFGGE